MKFEVNNESSLPEVVKKILAAFPENRIFAIDGEMGAGKTTIIKYFCKALEVEDSVASPTFAIVYEYSRKTGDTVFHFDFYRIKNLAEAMDIGTEEYLYSGEYCFIEWPGEIEELLPPGHVYIKLEKGNEDSQRIIHIEPVE
jgi:tRNA threonylcarbamoyladenosine biosynthesis protein TsaE